MEHIASNNISHNAMHLTFHFPQSRLVRVIVGRHHRAFNQSFNIKCCLIAVFNSFALYADYNVEVSGLTLWSQCLITSATHTSVWNHLPTYCIVGEHQYVRDNAIWGDTTLKKVNEMENIRRLWTGGSLSELGQWTYGSHDNENMADTVCLKYIHTAPTHTI